MAKIAITLDINGETHDALVEPDRTLLDVLRTDLGLTGTKTNCLDAECGVCTVLVDGAAVNACLYLAVVAQGRAITTIEGLAPAGHAPPLQEAFMEFGAVQCGYCIPGMILSAKAYLDECPRPTEAQVREALSGNLCRCTGYQKIVDAVSQRIGAPRRTGGGAMTTTTRVVGQSLTRIDAPGKVTGSAIYAADFALPGMLCGKVFRSAEPHARLVKLDTSKALRIPGVRAVITAADAADVRYGAAVKDEPVFASDIVRYRGQPVAAVAATTLEAAEAALAAIEAVYEPLPPVFDLADGARAGRPARPRGWQSYVAVPILQRDGNVCNRARIVVGDVERGWAEADRIFEHRFTTAMVHQGYTEPRAAVASWDSSGQVTVWSNTQLPFDVQSTLAEILAIAPSKIRVIVPGVGGGFGGKLRVGVEHFAALLAKKSGRPVKIMTTGEEELTAAYPRQGTLIELKTGVTRDGRLTARQGRIYFDTGAFAGSGPGVASVATMVLAGPYRTPNLFLEGYAVYTNKTNCGSYRAPSGPQANFAVESQMDIIADALGIDPLELRLRNIVREGDEGPTGQVLTAVGLEECLLRAADAIGWKDRRPAPGRGKGIACGWWTTTGGSSGVYVKINPDGTVALNTGAVEIGTGALTGAAQVLAEELGVDLTDINVVSADTFSTPFDFGAQGSRTAFAVGNACRARSG